MFLKLLKTMAYAFILIFLWHLIGVFGDEVKIVSVKEGDSVTLHTDVNQIQKYTDIEWTFGGDVIAKVNIKTQPILYNDSPERLRDRLKLDQTGSLTITNTRTTDSGNYILQMYGTPYMKKTFGVTIYAPLSLPVITSYCPSSSSSVYGCALVCSVVNVSPVTLSWYKGNSLLSSISTSNVRISLSLPLEVKHQDKNSYSCVINNPIRNQTTHLNISKLCHTCSVPTDISCPRISCCDTEAVIRLVVSVLMGVAAAAAVVVLIYDIRSRKVEHRRREQTK
ncbi:SLAM family member 9-like [Carassius carassius]|uniref:SLAM family member 9-like n=1 Tax=Carassius carassius TaxID=217509 RepID=UPI0028686A6F|nr:SLAM family member 9-like [Carassius carassius]